MSCVVFFLCLFFFNSVRLSSKEVRQILNWVVAFRLNVHVRLRAVWVIVEGEPCYTKSRWKENYGLAEFAPAIQWRGVRISLVRCSKICFFLLHCFESLVEQNNSVLGVFHLLKENVNIKLRILVILVITKHRDKGQTILTAQHFFSWRICRIIPCSSELLHLCNYQNNFKCVCEGSHSQTHPGHLE